MYRADNLEILVESTFWNPKGLSKPVYFIFNFIEQLKEGRLVGLVTSCLEAAFQNTLLKKCGRKKWREDEEVDVSNYWMILRKVESTGN